ncbi:MULTISPECIES: hypothetical protein [Planktothricoides]|uniref:Uncharacterized protein n=2 Tax=Planktothricoides raciborskii TaxID=132608 RepID=A0AAU8JEV7_9CYAN|nr:MULTISPECIES: hypothetical protein [Planktothricoides]KOR35235.1 hypothetical protein AM228_19580 [Planktothricoides sp. SR001]MBD2544793.1 hypothetical protein [Planktothricoides raciborskii FACHB-1370]MBD2582800.1 hypothetical protein [Planktothricoides raciborskii FACHB-1261]
MTLSKLSPALYLLLALTIASWLGLAEPTMAATDRTPQMADNPTVIASVVHPQTPLSQVRGDLAAVWKNHGVSGSQIWLTRNVNDGLKDLPGCACAACSGINREIFSPVG